MRQRFRAIVGVLAILGVLFAGAAAARAAEPHPYIYNGYRLLSRAHYVLAKGKHHFGGHRIRAMKQIAAAIQELKLAIAADHGTVPAAITEAGAPQMVPGQRHPYMHDALGLCREAKASLEQGAHSFKGHRITALQHVDAAIAELEQAANWPEHE